MSQIINLSDESRSEIKKKLNKFYREQQLDETDCRKYADKHMGVAKSKIVDRIRNSDAPLRIKNILIREFVTKISVQGGPNCVRQISGYMNKHKKWLLQYVFEGAEFDQMILGCSCG